MYILRSTGVVFTRDTSEVFTPAQNINKLGAYRRVADTGMPWTAENCLLLFKRLESIKKVLKKCGNVEEYKAYRLIPPMPTLFNGWTIPLKVVTNEKGEASGAVHTIRY
jgi:hypothetical protein